MKSVDDLSYPDFVGQTGQENAPPAGQVAYDYWIEEAKVTENSYCLDLACSTGLTSRYLSQNTGCRAVGIDISLSAINEARRRASCVDSELKYICADASILPFPERHFSHVAVGSSFGFINARKRALSQTARVLKQEGALLVACRHYTNIPPKSLLDSVVRAIGYRPDLKRDYNWWRNFFLTEFAVSKEMHVILPEVDPNLMTYQLEAAIDTPGHPLQHASHAKRRAVLNRFLETREILAEHDMYQALTLMCWWK